MEKKIVGYKEYVKICIQGKEYRLKATFDTGNGGIVPTLGVTDFFVSKTVIEAIIEKNNYVFENLGDASPLVGGKHKYRPIIKLDYLEIDGEKIENIKFGLSNERKNYSTQILLNRDTLSKFNLLIDPSKEYTLKRDT